MPIFEITFSSPLRIAAISCSRASAGVTPGSSSARPESSSTESSIRYGLTALAP